MSKAKLIPESELNIAKNIKIIAQDVLLNQPRTFENPVNFTVKTYDECVKEFYSSKSHFIITGIGKSANKANKIVSRINSINTPYVFMPAAATIYGELGIIQREDIVINISTSGTTPKIKAFVPLLKRKVSTLVAQVSNTYSYLGQRVEYSICKKNEDIELLFNDIDGGQ